MSRLLLFIFVRWRQNPAIAEFRVDFGGVDCGYTSVVNPQPTEAVSKSQMSDSKSVAFVRELLVARNPQFPVRHFGFAVVPSTHRASGFSQLKEDKYILAGSKMKPRKPRPKVHSREITNFKFSIPRVQGFTSLRSRDFPLSAVQVPASRLDKCSFPFPSDCIVCVPLLIANRLANATTFRKSYLQCWIVAGNGNDQMHF